MLGEACLACYDEKISGYCQSLENEIRIPVFKRARTLGQDRLGSESSLHAETENYLHVQFPYFLGGHDNTYLSGLYGS